MLPGEKAVLTADAEGIENVVYTWYVNGVEKAKGQTYEISNDYLGKYNVTVTAYAPELLRAGSAIKVYEVGNDPQSVIKEWTIMIYMDADNNLEGMGLDDINEMEAVDLRNSSINIIT